MKGRRLQYGSWELLRKNEGIRLRKLTAKDKALIEEGCIGNIRMDNPGTEYRGHYAR